MMKLWLKKISVVLITMMTLGLYIPPVYLTDAQDEGKTDVAEAPSMNDDGFPLGQEADTITVTTNRIDELTEQARDQTLTKLGPRIINQVDEEFTEVILPKMEEVIRTILTDVDEEASYYEITENPADGYGERIFNIYDHLNKENIALFHVRRDKRPLDGYWFNFHYHLSRDHFETHYEIGDLYWDKNIPPKWMS